MAKKAKTIAGQWVWSNSPHAFRNAHRADPNVIGFSLKQIADAHGGRLEPDRIIEAARASRHPLHRHFEWNDERAAYQHRLDTARRIVRSVMLIDPNKPNEPPQRAWISVQDNGVSYRGIEEVLTESRLQLAIMKRALSDLTAWQQRYKGLERICGGAVAAARAQLVAQIAAAEERKEAA
jgi:hypothetical protein